ncbi:MAG: TonB-dependent receptor plug domain-containing protein, partial [Gemmatimonas sp.]|nr:TonB-dependent receptor plug domain-containing protein [Gemmatimonas sp.]
MNHQRERREMKVWLPSLAAGLLLLVASPVAASQRQTSMTDEIPQPGPSAASILDAPANLDTGDVSLQRALALLHLSSRIPVLFSPTLLPDIVVNCSCTDSSVGQALQRLLEETTFSFEAFGQQVIVYPSAHGDQPAVAGMPSSLPNFGAGHAIAPAARDSGPAQPQATGSIRGSVTDARLGRPIAAAQIYVADSGPGALSQQDGEFVIANVTPGQNTLSAELIGYRTASRRVVVGTNGVVDVDFTLVEEPLQLDEVIVTGTPGGLQRRAIGNSVGTVQVSDLTETAQINSIQDLLTGVTPGLDFALSPGNVGTGSPIRIRGVSSLELNQQPLIYVDGVRVNNATDAGPYLGGGANNASGGQVSVLEDFSPEEIESIEIIKGPAAATLYGTEASAGVIQIITKKGVQGAPQFSVSVSQGANYLSDPSGKLGTQWGISPTGDLIEGFDGYPNIYEYEKEVLGNDPLQYGRAQSYSLDVRGGTEDVRYFLSGGWQDNEGIVDYNFNERVNLRGNIGVAFSDALNLDLSTGFITGLTSFAQQLTEPGGIWDAMMWAQPELKDTDRRGFMRFTPEELATVEATREYRRFTASTILTHRLGSWLMQRLVAGLDRSSDENQVLVPRHQLGTASAFGGIGLGDVQLSRPITNEVTLDYSANAEYAVADRLSFTTSIGAQYYSSKLNRLNGYGSVLASPALRSIEGATRVSLGQDIVQNKSMGVYLQQQLSWNNRLFLTAAVRADDNSAFGSEFDAAIYPKVSGTWVISEEGFWNFPLVSSLRLRS